MDPLTELAPFLAQIDTSFIATSDEEGQPYVQHRGGPKGFLKVLDDTTLGFADFAGNRQYLTVGNLKSHDKVLLFLIDYERRRRVKVWGRARIVSDPELLRRLTTPGYKARIERGILVTATRWDVNCPAHIPQKLDAAAVKAAIDRLEARIAALEAENATLRAG